MAKKEIRGQYKNKEKNERKTKEKRKKTYQNINHV